MTQVRMLWPALDARSHIQSESNTKPAHSEICEERLMTVADLSAILEDGSEMGYPGPQPSRPAPRTTLWMTGSHIPAWHPTYLGTIPSSGLPESTDHAAFATRAGHYRSASQ
jgi:hypothetical protein